MKPLSIVVLIGAIILCSTLSAVAAVKTAAVADSGKEANGAQMVADVNAKLGEKPDVYLYVLKQDADCPLKVLKQIRSAAPDIELVGLETIWGGFSVDKDGMISGDHVLIALKATHDTQITVKEMEYTDEASMVAGGRAFGESLKPASDRRAVLLMLTHSFSSHELRKGTAALCKNIQDGLGTEVPVTGGNGIKVFHNDKPAGDLRHIGICISDPAAKVASVQETGKVAISPPLELTATEEVAKEDVITELGGRPWRETFRKYTKDYLDDAKFEEEVKKSFCPVSLLHPLVYIKGKGRDFARLSHEISKEVDGLEVECYRVVPGEKVYITRIDDDQPKIVARGIDRVTYASDNLTFLVACCSNTEYCDDPNFGKAIAAVLKPNSVVLGFVGIGEYGAIFDKNFDVVGPLRYRQLSYIYANISFE